MNVDPEPDSARTQHEDFNFNTSYMYSIEFVLGVVSNITSYLSAFSLCLAP
jgi:hypothetical protein